MKGRKINRECKIFPYGVHFYREPSLPMVQLKHDMKIIKKLGFNMLKIQESWAIDEPVEGKINLSKIEELIAQAKELGLYIYFGVTMEQAPAWLWKKYPDCYLVYNTGQPHDDPTQYLLAADGKPGPCWDHPGARKSGEQFIVALVKKIGRYENILVWNVWQEVGFWPMRPGTLGFCYCPNTLTLFRKWLKEKYSNLKKLNSIWRTAYGGWEEIEPPREYPPVPSWIDWRYFMDDVYLARAIRWKADAIRKNDPYRRPVFCHMGAPTIGSGVEWQFAREVDIFGSSCYPAWGPFHQWDMDRAKSGGSISLERGLKTEMSEVAIRFDYIRSACAEDTECWAAEFQGGPISTFLQKGRTPSPSDIQRWVLTALSSGIQGLSFWNHRVEIFWQEAYGFGLLDSRGDKSDRAEEAGRIGKAVNKYADVFLCGRLPKAEVGILINEDLWHFTQATSDAQKHLTHTIRGIYKMLWESGVWIDFLELNVQGGELKKYKVIILPFPLAISDELMQKLKNYVSNGGVLISEACPGRYDKYGFTRSGEISSIAEKLFGVEHKNVVLCHEPGETHWMLPERSYGEIIPSTRFSGTGPFKGHSVLASLYVETFISKGSKPILYKENESTGVVNSHGKGKAYLIGTFIGHAGITNEDEPTREFLLKLLADSGVKQERCGSLLRRRRILKDKEAWFLINPTNKTISETIDFSGFTKVEDLLEGPIDKSKPIEVREFAVRTIILNG